jgi:CRISPR-associated protein Cas1
MQIVIDAYGSYLQKNGDCFKITGIEKPFEISCRRVSSILISTAASLSTDAIKMAAENNIDIIFLNKFGEPYGRVWHCKLGSTALIRRKQLEISFSEKGLELAMEWVAGKINNQIKHLRKLGKNRKKKAGPLEDAVTALNGIKEKISAQSGIVDEKRGTVMALEGMAGKIYFDALSEIVPHRFKFDGRSANPAKDEFNAMLNYSYGILYSMVEKACIIAGLDPYTGLLHTDNYNKKSFVFDIIEIFRVYAEETVVRLFAGRKIKTAQFDSLKGGLSLNKEGKAVLVEAFNKNLDAPVRYRGRNIKKRNTIQFECHGTANRLLAC